MSNAPVPPTSPARAYIVAAVAVLLILTGVSWWYLRP
jgi:hypothetical protein